MFCEQAIGLQQVGLADDNNSAAITNVVQAAAGW